MPRGRPRTHRTRKGNGQGTIYQRKSDGLWTGQVVVGRRPDGKAIRKAVYGHTAEEVDKKLSDLKVQAAAGTVISSQSYTVKEWSEIWMANYKIPFVEKSTAQDYQNVVTYYLLPQIGGYKVNKLAPIICQNVINHYKEKGLARSTLYKIRHVLKQMLEQAVDENLILKNPAAKLKLPKAPKTKVPAISTELVDQILDAIKDTSVEGLFNIMVYAGLRPGEAFGLHGEDIDLESGFITVNRAVSMINRDKYLKSPKTETSTRVVPIRAELKEVLEKYRCRFIEGAIAFPTPRSKSYYDHANFRKRLHAILVDKGLAQVNPYQGRHTCFTRLKEDGLDTLLISVMAGHDSIETTADTYIDVQKEALKKAVLELKSKIDGKASGNGS